MALFLEILKKRWPMWSVVVFASVVSALLGLLSPYLQKLFVDQLLGLHIPHFFEIQLSPLLCLVLGFAVFFLSQAIVIWTQYLGMKESLIFQKDAGEKMYKHVLSLRTDSWKGRQVGEIVSQLATDVPGAAVIIEQSLPTGAAIFFPIFLAPFAIYYLFGIPLFGVLAVMAVVFALNLVLSYRQSKFFQKFKRLAAERIGIVNEWVQNIRSLRIWNWVGSFEEKIFSKRIEETKNRVDMVTNGQVMSSLASSVTYAINIAGVWALTSLKATAATPGEILALLWILGIFLSRPFRQLPWFFTFLIDSSTSFRRLANLFSLSNEPFQLKAHTPCAKGLEVRHLNLKIQGRSVLEDVSFHMAENEFVGIIGDVGSGKSQLLLSLLGETRAQVNGLSFSGLDLCSLSLEERRGLFTYVPQEGFVISSSLRDNVALEYDIDSSNDDRVRSALRLAQFDENHEGLTQGLATEIGERGVNLSGGQKQRVNLARAIFYSRPIVLLDDCMSAVDIQTEKKLIESLVKGRWKNSLRILVTHRLSVLEHVDRVLFLNHGRIQGFDTFANLEKSSSLFRDFVSTMSKSEKGEMGEALPVSDEEAVTVEV